MTAKIDGSLGFTGANFVIPPQGRLTLQTGVPVMTSTQSGKTLIYYTPYVGQMVPVYDGAVWTMLNTGGELSNATAQSSSGNAGPAAVTTNSNYDLFVWSNGGVPTLTRGPAWTSATARGTGAGTTELVLTNGIYLNANAITNGPSASRGTYVGSVRSNGSSTIDWTLGAAASGGTAGVLNVWNMYNRVSIGTYVKDSGSPYTYTGASIRQARASSGNQISFLSGLAEDSIQAFYYGEIYTAGANVGANMGIGLDSITAYSTNRGVVYGLSSAIASAPNCVVATQPLLGSHYVAALEASDGGSASNFDNQSTNFLMLNFRM